MSAALHTAEPHRVPHISDWRARQWQQHPREMRRAARRHHQELLAALGKLRRLYARWCTYPVWNRPASPECLLHDHKLTLEAARRSRAEIGAFLP